ncbi:MAG: NADH-quinone oxidoreductase subunit J [Desulfobacteraceae bacterium]|nr:MAG: NADH-quinone oxidoreductase subunit J [Desulfobacteraceae bacterium]
MNPTLNQYLSPEILTQAIFVLAVLVTLGGALLAVLHREIVHNIFGLATCVCGVAGLFIFLNSEFLAVMAILIYVGAISVAIVYAVMLSVPLYRKKEPRRLSKLALSFLSSALAFTSLVLIIIRTPWEPSGVTGADWSIRRLGILLFTRYELLFELISLVLLVAIVGAIITAAVVNKKEPGPGSGEGQA